MRGVHIKPPGARRLVLGSSPHARGPLFYKLNDAARNRIIPACAGSTSVVSGLNRMARDHPRMRGVHQKILNARELKAGSSPHARGPPSPLINSVVTIRIIPACAGSTAVFVHHSGDFKDHPRMRGVHRNVSLCGRSGIGSSPHARGPLAHNHHCSSSLRIIPACAGST